MTETSKNVYACIDGSQDSFAVCDWANWASQQLGVPIVLIHGLERADDLTKVDYSGHIGLGSREYLLDELVKLDEHRGRVIKEHGKAILNEAAAYLKSKGANNVSTSLRHGNLVECLTDLVKTAELIVIGHTGTEHQREMSVIGSQVESVIRTLHAPIAVVQPPFIEPKDVLFAYDGSDTAKKVLDLVLKTDLLRNRKCHLLHVGDDTKDVLTKAEVRLENAGFAVEKVVRKGEVATVILEYSDEMDCGLLLMGAYGHSRIRQFLVGSNTTKILQHTKIPLVLIK